MKKTGCIISGFQLDYVSGIIERLPSDYEVKLVIVHPDDYEKALITLPSVEVMSRFNSRVALFEGFETEMIEGAVDGPVFEHYSRHLETGLSMFSRMDSDGTSIPYEERIRAFWDMVSHWESFVKRNNVRVVISREVPHFTSEYILSRACERNGGKVLMTVYIEHLTRTMVFSELDGRDVSIVDNIDGSVKERMRGVIKRLRSRYSDAITEVIADVNLSDAKSGIFWELKRFTRLVGWAVKRGPFGRSNISLSFGGADGWKKNPSRIRIALYFFRMGRKIRGIHRYYRELCAKLEKLPDNYVFVAPNYQPEQTTLPDGGDFYYMPNVVDLVLRAIPHDWVVVYKEHPAVFKQPYKHLFRGHMMRDRHFYDRLSNDRVVIVPETLDTFELLDNSRFVISVSGTILLEAVSRNKHAVMLGNVWCQSLSGVTKISRATQLEEYVSGERYTEDIDEDRLVEVMASMYLNSAELVPLLNGGKKKEPSVDSELDIYWQKVAGHLE